jgi:hypothetical protein
MCSDGNLSWLDSFNFSTDHKFYVGTIMVDFDDPLKEYIPVISSLMRVLKEEFCFQYIVKDNGRAKSESEFGIITIKVNV